jgi:DNA-binding Xre family transcriptional regulator
MFDHSKLAKMLSRRGALSALARDSGVDKGTISRLARGEAQGISFEQVAMLARALNCSLDVFVAGAPVHSASDARDQVIQLFGGQRDARAVAALRSMAVTPGLSAEYWLRQLDALDARYR